NFPAGRAPGSFDPAEGCSLARHLRLLRMDEKELFACPVEPEAKGGGLPNPRVGRRATSRLPVHRGIRSSYRLSQGGFTTMHKRMTRILSTVGLMLVVPAVALASSSRVAALDVPGDYIKDYTGIFTYVSGVNSVGNLVYAEPNNAPGGPPNEALGAV